MESQWDIHNEVVATENEMKMIKINNWDDVGFENLFAITPCLKDERTNMPEQYAQMEYARTSKRLVLSWTDFNKNKNQFSLNKIVYSSPAYRWNSVKPPKKKPWISAYNVPIYSKMSQPIKYYIGRNCLELLLDHARNSAKMCHHMFSIRFSQKYCLDTFF